jgi:hypothetical protein
MTTSAFLLAVGLGALLDRYLWRVASWLLRDEEEPEVVGLPRGHVRLVDGRGEGSEDGGAA